MSRAIYVVRAEPGPVKIGIANNARRRFGSLRTSSAFPLALEFVALTTGAPAIERRAHEILSHTKARGEWFSVSTQQAIGAVMQAATELGFELQRLDERGPQERGSGKTALIALRVDPKLKADAEIAAEEDHRSLTSLIEKLLLDYLQRRRPR